MPQPLDLLDHVALSIATSGLLYTLITILAGVVALFARSSARRRDARKVLRALLLRRNNRLE